MTCSSFREPSLLAHHQPRQRVSQDCHGLKQLSGPAFTVQRCQVQVVKVVLVASNLGNALLNMGGMWGAVAGAVTLIHAVGCMEQNSPGSRSIKRTAKGSLLLHLQPTALLLLHAGAPAAPAAAASSLIIRIIAHDAPPCTLHSRV